MALPTVNDILMRVRTMSEGTERVVAQGNTVVAQLERLEEQQKRQTTAAKATATTTEQVAREMRGLGASAGQAERAIFGTTRAVDRASNRIPILTNLYMQAARAAEAFARSGFGIVQILEAGAREDRLHGQLTVLLGDAGAAREELERLDAFTNRAGFGAQQIEEARVELLALGIEGERALKAVTNVAAFVGRDVSAVIRALVSAQQGQFMGLRRLGIDMDEIFASLHIKESQRQNLTRVQTKQVVDAILTEWEVRFAGGLERASADMQGMLAQLGNRWGNFKEDIAESGLGDFADRELRKLISKLDELEKNGALDRFAQDLSDAFTKGGVLVVNFTRNLGDLVRILQEIGLAVNRVQGWLENVPVWLASTWDEAPGLAGPRQPTGPTFLRRPADTTRFARQNALDTRPRRGAGGGGGGGMPEAEANAMKKAMADVLGAVTRMEDEERKKRETANEAYTKRRLDGLIKDAQFERDLYGQTSDQYIDALWQRVAALRIGSAEHMAYLAEIGRAEDEALEKARKRRLEPLTEEERKPETSGGLADVESIFDTHAPQDWFDALNESFIDFMLQWEIGWQHAGAVMEFSMAAGVRAAQASYNVMQKASYEWFKHHRGTHALAEKVARAAALGMLQGTAEALAKMAQLKAAQAFAEMLMALGHWDFAAAGKFALAAAKWTALGGVAGGAAASVANTLEGGMEAETAAERAAGGRVEDEDRGAREDRLRVVANAQPQVVHYHVTWVNQGQVVGLNETTLAEMVGKMVVEIIREAQDTGQLDRAANDW
jgi:hypothetical protein